MREARVKMGRGDIQELFTSDYASGGPRDRASRSRTQSGRVKLKPWNLESDRFLTWKGIDDNAAALWAWLVQGSGRKFASAAGIVLESNRLPKTVFMSKRDPSQVAVEVHSVRTALRRTARGSTVTDLVVEITQRRRGYFDKDEQEHKDERGTGSADSGDFRYRAGCTLLMDPVTMSVRRVIRTADTIADNEELERQRRFLVDGGLEPTNAYALATNALRTREPFALLHRNGA
jgi:hypothetical protein